MKKLAVVVMVSMFAFTMVAQANDALVEKVLLLQFCEEAGISDYGLIEVLQGYDEYRSMMDDLAAERAEAAAKLEEALAGGKTGPDVLALARELMELDMDILETKQSAVSEAGSVLGSEAVGKLYLIVSDPAAAKANMMAELAGTPAAACSMAGTPACPMAAQAAAAAPAVDPATAIMERVMVFLNKLAAKDLDGAMAAVADDFEHYDFKTKADLRAFLDDAIATGYLDDIEIQTEDAEVKIDGDKAVVYPVDIVGMFGTVTLELVGEMRDGQYMLTTIDAFGI
jgi:ketosteroid isomerase-like protein